MSKKIHTLALISILAATACSRAPTLLIISENIPPSAASLKVYITHIGNMLPLATSEELLPSELPVPAPNNASLLLRLPDGFSGEISANVGTFSEPHGTGCLLRTGSASRMFNPMPLDDSIIIDLQDVLPADSDCNGSPLRLFSAEAASAGIASKEVIKLNGWGFQPNAKVNFGDIQSVNISYQSASTLMVEAPVAANAGAVTISVENANGNKISHDGIFRYIYKSLAFSPTSIDITEVPDDIYSDNFDSNGDGDLAVLSLAKNRIYISLNSKTNTPSLAPFSLSTIISSNIAHTDIDLDGDIDIGYATTDAGVGQACRALNNGQGSFLIQNCFNVGMNPTAMVIGDVDGDKLPDMVTVNQKSGTPSTGEISVLKNNGRGGFENSVSFALTSVAQPSAVVLFDFDADGDLDAVIADTDSTKHHVYVAYNPGNGQFNPPVSSGFSIPLDGAPSALLTADVDGDGRPDLIVPQESAGHVYVTLSRKPAETMPLNLSVAMGPRTVAVADMNGDGLADLLVGAATANQVHIFLQQPRLTPTAPLFLAQPSNSYTVPSAVGTLRKIAIGFQNARGRETIIIAGTTTALGVLVNQSL